MKDGQCARCGSSVTWEQCWCCQGTGTFEICHGDDYEDCDVCLGLGGVWYCISGSDWCEANPLPGRESAKRGTIETFEVEESA